MKSPPGSFPDDRRSSEELKISDTGFGFVTPASIPEVSLSGFAQTGLDGQRGHLSNDSIRHILASIHSAFEDTGRSERRTR